MAFLSSAALQSSRVPLEGEFEPFRLSISADSTPDFVSSRTNPYEIPRSRHSDLDDEDNDDDDYDNINASGDEPDREIAATVDVEIIEVKIYSGTDLGTEPGNPPYTIADPGEDAVMRTHKVVSGLYAFEPPMDLVGMKIDGGPSGAETVECFGLTEVMGRFVKFGLGVWIFAEDVIGVYCSAYYAMEEVEGEGREGRAGLE